MALHFPLKADFDFALSLPEALKFCEPHKVVASTEEGPGGGNPNVELEFSSDEELRAFCKKYGGDAPGMAEEAYELSTQHHQ